MPGVKVKESKIAGLGLFTDQEFNEGDMIGIAHIDGQPTNLIGKYHNHSESPNAHSILLGNKRYIAALRPLSKGEEITVDYRKQPELEQPEEFAKGGAIKMPKQSSKKKFTKSLTGTNKLFTKNSLFEKHKSKKNKVYDPNSKFQKGGEPGDKFKERLMKRNPGMQGVYGPEGENLNIVKDPNYDARSYGYGDIEFMAPGLEQVNYENRIDKNLPGYTYVNPSPDKYTSVYNPRGANRADIFLDMMHGMRDDQNYEPLLQNFDKAVRDARAGDMQHFYEQDVAKGYTDSQEQWNENYIDGQLRAQLAPGTLGMFSHGRRDYRKERRHDSPEMRAAGKDIRNYIKGEYQEGGESDEREKTRFVPGTFDPTETAGYMLTEKEVPVTAQASNWGKARAKYKKRHPEEEFIEKKKKQYVRQSNKGLNKLFGVNTENFNPNVEQNFRDEYDYLTNTAVVKNVSRQEGWNPNRRAEYVDNLNDTQRQIVAQSKYGSKLQPGYWNRALAGLQELGNTLSPGQPFQYNIPGLTKKEQKEMRDSKLSAFEMLAPIDIPGAAIANFVKNRGLTTGSDYKELPGLLSGEKMENVTDMEAMAFNPLTYAGLEALPETAVNLAKGTYKLGKTGINALETGYEAAKVNPQSWFQTSEQLLDNPNLYRTVKGETTWKDPLGKLNKFVDDSKIKSSLKRENELIDKYPGYENRKIRIPLQQEEQNLRFAIEKAAEERNLRRSRLPIKPILNESGIQLGGGQGRLYMNTLDPTEVVKLGTFPGTSTDLQNLVEAGKNLEGMPLMENVAFPTKGFTIDGPSANAFTNVKGNSEAVQFMPWKGNPLNTENPVNIPFDFGIPSDRAKRELQFMAQTLDDNKVGIDYFGQNNMMYDPKSDSYKLVDLNYVDDPKSAFEWNKLDKPVKQRIEDKFGYEIPQGELPLELEFANSKSIKPLLGEKIGDNTGRFNLGVYNFKDYPQYIAKVEDPAAVAATQGLDAEQYMSAMVDRTKNLDPSEFSKVFRTVEGKEGKRVLVMPKLRGTLGSKLDTETLMSIPDQAYTDFYDKLKLLRDEGLNYDFYGDNFMYDPYTEKFNLFDFSPQSAIDVEPGYGNKQFFETEVFGRGNPNIYGKEQAGKNLKDALGKRLTRTYMETFPGDQEMYGLDEYNKRITDILRDLSPQKYGGIHNWF